MYSNPFNKKLETSNNFWVPKTLSPIYLLKIRLHNLGHNMGGGANRMGGGKRTRERALPKNSGTLQKSFWSAQSWILVQKKKKATTPEGGGKRTIPSDTKLLPK